MKKLITLLSASFIVFFAFAQEEATEEKPGPRITFEEEKFDFGDIHQGDKVEHTFAFENTGTEPLVLTNVQTTCGCTVPQWPRQPIPPGQKAEVKVAFNSAGKMGKVTKVVKIISNATTPITQVTIHTNILPKKKADTDTK
ncbi:MAG: DUF1573 domain-containing protein [Cyclobacteriaceae bacterium]|nr:DUF1573 domain-containing protein [Cyclobacteriaceae bacterium]